MSPGSLIWEEVQQLRGATDSTEGQMVRSRAGQEARAAAAGPARSVSSSPSTQPDSALATVCWVISPSASTQLGNLGGEDKEPEGTSSWGKQ